jgi:hypothetical protein
LRSGGYSSQLLDAIDSLRSVGEFIATIPAYLSLLEMTFCVEIRDYLSDDSGSSPLASLSGPEKRQHQDAIGAFLERTNTDQKLAVLCAFTDISVNDTNAACTRDGVQSTFQSVFDPQGGLRARDRPSAFVNQLPGDYRCSRADRPKSLPSLIRDNFEQGHQRPTLTYGRYMTSRSMRNRIVHADPRELEIALPPGHPDMQWTSPSRVQLQHVEYVRDATADMIDFLTRLHYNKL